MYLWRRYCCTCFIFYIWLSLWRQRDEEDTCKSCTCVVVQFALAGTDCHDLTAMWCSLPATAALPLHQQSIRLCLLATVLVRQVEEGALMAVLRVAATGAASASAAELAVVTI